VGRSFRNIGVYHDLNKYLGKQPEITVHVITRTKPKNSISNQELQDFSNQSKICPPTAEPLEADAFILLKTCLNQLPPTPQPMNIPWCKT
jgi:hypothetical protein